MGRTPKTNPFLVDRRTYRHRNKKIFPFSNIKNDIINYNTKIKAVGRETREEEGEIMSNHSEEAPEDNLVTITALLWSQVHNFLRIKAVTGV